MTYLHTFLFTDIQGSSHLWEKATSSMRTALASHDALLKEAVENHNGRIVKTTGDGLHAVFESAADGVAAALAGQHALKGASWPAETGPLLVRMGFTPARARNAPEIFTVRRSIAPLASCPPALEARCCYPPSPRV